MNTIEVFASVIGIIIIILIISKYVITIRINKLLEQKCKSLERKCELLEQIIHNHENSKTYKAKSLP